MEPAKPGSRCRPITRFWGSHRATTRSACWHLRLPEHLATTVDLEHLPYDAIIQIAGLIVCRQRPGTAKGITFLLMEDERGW